MPKKRRSRAFWKNFKFKYKLTVVNENTLEEIVGLRVSKLNGLSVLLSVLAVLFLIAACIIAFTPLQNYLPGYMNSEVRTQIVDNALRVDSLQQILNKQNLYIMNIQDIFSGKVAIDYLIGVQHNQDLISIYKHCGSLLKKEGERVKGGEAIALVGNSGTLSTGPHLHFELWYKGHPINPEKYIVF